ncbi:hypothetical protein M3Y98_00636100 [Aphelenchoides besseyi]|nr:hypothetical protein M3Y98_00636100 [Aphelenchoides besseyi]
MESTPMKCDYQDTSQRFHIDEFDVPFTREESTRFYETRYRCLLPRVLKRSPKSSDIESIAFSELVPQTQTFISGVLNKVPRRRQSGFRKVLKSCANEEDEHDPSDIFAHSPATCYNKLFIENDFQRLELDGNVEQNHLVGGYVVGLFGELSEDGKRFTVEQLLFPELSSSVPWPTLEKDIYVMFLSDLGLKHRMGLNASIMWTMLQLFDWLEKEDKKIGRDFDDEEDRFSSSYDLGSTVYEQAGWIFARLAKYADGSDLIPGLHDDMWSCWPQIPLEKTSFGRFANANFFHTKTNPYSFTIDGVNFLGTSGQNLTDLRKYTCGQSVEKLMMQMIKASHICPTSPKTIEEYSFEDRDPFILDEIPHVFFAGNQDRHFCKTVEFENGARTVLLTIPRFQDNYEVILLNIRTMQTQRLRLSLPASV